MSLFATIMEKIFHRGGPPVAQPAAAAAAIPQAAPATAPTATPAPAPQPAVAAQVVDVEAVLATLASEKGGGGNWRTSIVDLLRLLDMDPSLEARKTLAGELEVRVGPDGSAEENIALHKAVMRKLADNGGKVPDSLKG